MELLEHELVALEQTRSKIERLRTFLTTHEAPGATANAGVWFAYLSAMKSVLGTVNIDLSFVACLMAKSYLMARFDLAPFDAAEKAQGAKGLDIDAVTASGNRIIGEIRTTDPHLIVKFGGAQGKRFEVDIAKLQATPADHKFLFVTNPQAFEALRVSYRSSLDGVNVVCLTSGDEFEGGSSPE